MLFSTSLVAVVGSGVQPTSSQRRLRILNTKKKTNICELTFPSNILSVKLNRKRLIVVLLDQIYIYDISCMKLLHTIETQPNHRGVVDLSANDESILVYPSGNSNENSPLHHKDGQDNNIGTVLVFDALNITPLNIIQAHKTSLSCIALNSNGSLLATSSSKGTIIRVFNTLSGSSLNEFRRGSYSVVVSNIVFRQDSKVIAVGSDTGTVHLFKLEQDSEDTKDEQEVNQEYSLPQLLRSNSTPTKSKRKVSITQTLLRNLPKNLTSILEPERDFAYLKLSHSNFEQLPTSSSSTASLPARSSSPIHLSQELGFNGNDIVVANYNDSSLSLYSVPSTGGECVLTKQYSLLN